LIHPPVKRRLGREAMKKTKEKVFEIGGAKVIIAPNGLEEIWIMPTDSVPWVNASTPEASEFRAWYEGRGPYPVGSNQEEK
jgi:hypothetical protein